MAVHGAFEGGAASGANVGEGEGEAEGDQGNCCDGTTVMRSFCPFLQWFAKPEMYHLLPYVVNTTVSCPLPNTGAAQGTEQL